MGMPVRIKDFKIKKNNNNNKKKKKELTVRTECGTMDCFQIGKGVRQGYILSPLFTLNAEFSSVAQ